MKFIEQILNNFWYFCDNHSVKFSVLRMRTVMMVSDKNGRSCCQALALEKDAVDEPEDSIDPKADAIDKRLGTVGEEFVRSIGLQPGSGGDGGAKAAGTKRKGQIYEPLILFFGVYCFGDYCFLLVLISFFKLFSRSKFISKQLKCNIISKLD